MEEQLRRQAAVIADLTVRLEFETIRELRFVTAQGEQKSGTPEHTVLECQIRMSRMRSRELRGKIVAAHAKLARLKIEAEIERLRSLQRPATEVDLARLRRMTKRAIRDQRRQARRAIRKACNVERACDRLSKGRSRCPNVSARPTNNSRSLRRRFRSNSSTSRCVSSEGGSPVRVTSVRASPVVFPHGHKRTPHVTSLSLNTLSRATRHVVSGSAPRQHGRANQ